MKKVLGLFVLILIFAGCEKDNSEELKEKEKQLLEAYLADNNITTSASNGIYYIEESAGDKVIDVELEDFVVATYTVTLIDGTIVVTTDKAIAVKNGIYSETHMYGPMRLDVDTELEGLATGLQRMSEGDSATIIIPSDYAYGSFNMGVIEPYSTLIYSIKIEKVVKDMEAYEQSLLDAYILKNDIVGETLSSGVIKIVEKEGSGSRPEYGQTVTVYMTYSLLDGNILQSKTEANDPFVFVYGDVPLLPDVEDVFKTMQKGSKITLIIPYENAYGTSVVTLGNGVQVPPYSTIIASIELVDFE